MAAAAGPASDALEAVTSMCQQTQDAVLESNAQMRTLIELLTAINTTLGGERGGGGDNSVRIGDDDAGTDNGEGDDGEGGVDGKSPSDDGGATSTPAVRARASDSVYEASCRDAPRHVTPAVYDCICGVCEVCYAKAASDANDCEYVARRDAPRHVTPAVYDCICGVCEVCYAKAASDANDCEYAAADNDA